MKLLSSIFAILGVCFAVAACQSNTKFKEDILASAGFKPTPPTTAAQVASLRSLPPHKLTMTTHKGKTIWVYADPTICGCLYVGNQDAYDAYVKTQRQRALLEVNSTTTQQAGDWDYGSAWSYEP